MITKVIDYRHLLHLLIVDAVIIIVVVAAVGIDAIKTKHRLE